MFDHPHHPQSSDTHRPRPHTRSVTGSLLLAASVPAVLWAVSHPLLTVLAVVAVPVAVLGVRALRARAADRSETTGPPVVAAGRTDGP